MGAGNRMGADLSLTYKGHQAGPGLSQWPKRQQAQIPVLLKVRDMGLEQRQVKTQRGLYL